MSGQITRKQVDWERANCLGLDTELFYEHRTGLEEQGLTLNHLRRTCFDCPIRKECLVIGVAHEPYGFWGGLNEDERRHVYDKKETRITTWLKRDLQLLGINYRAIFAEVRAVKRDFMYVNGHITQNNIDPVFRGK